VLHLRPGRLLRLLQTKAGWTPVQIRAGIARHEYESIDLDKQ